MSTYICRPCRDLARRQLRALVESNQAVRAAPPVAEIARNPRRQLHQTAIRHAEKPQSKSEPSSFAKTLTGIATAILPQRATQPYAIFGATDTIYKACSAPAAYTISDELRKKEEVPMTEDGEEIGVGGGVWHDEFGLLPTFSNWSQVTMLHLYLVVVRLRCLEKPAWQSWQTQLVNHFFQHAEDQMEVNHGMSRMIRSRHLNSLFQTWRGVLLAYDEGLVKGDAVMAAAVWRNVFKSSEDVDMRHVAAIVAWMRVTLRSLDEMLDPSLLYHGASVFKTQPTLALELPSLDAINASGAQGEATGGQSKDAGGQSKAAGGQKRHQNQVVEAVGSDNYAW